MSTTNNSLKICAFNILSIVVYLTNFFIKKINTVYSKPQTVMIRKLFFVRFKKQISQITKLNSLINLPKPSELI